MIHVKKYAIYNEDDKYVLKEGKQDMQEYIKR